jgi:hypothetical protein
MQKEASSVVNQSENDNHINHLKWQASKESLEQHLKDRMTKISSLEIQKQQQQNSRLLRPTDISSPILMATTLNPNDVDGHQSLSTFSSSSVLEHLNRRQVLHRQRTSPSGSTRLNPGDKITFKDLKRYASTSFASFSSGISFNRHSYHGQHHYGPTSLGQNVIGRSSFYEADNSQDSIYEDASKMRQTSPALSEHIYEEIPDRLNFCQAERERPLPPIPEVSKKNPNENSGSGAADVDGKKLTVVNRRNGSIFEGASKYEILHYLKVNCPVLSTVLFKL